jgi:hypothetical protein
MNVPDFAQITLRSQDGKIQVVETTTKEKF